MTQNAFPGTPVPTETVTHQDGIPVRRAVGLRRSGPGGREDRTHRQDLMFDRRTKGRGDPYLSNHQHDIASNCVATHNGWSQASKLLVERGAEQLSRQLRCCEYVVPAQLGEAAIQRRCHATPSASLSRRSMSAGSSSAAADRPPSLSSVRFSCAVFT